MAVEIERAFVAPRVPDAALLGAGLPLRQGYVGRDTDTEIRIRIQPGAATLTIKLGRGLRRTEIELPVPADEAELLWEHTAGRRLEKVRYRVPVDGLVADVDVFTDARLAGLCRIEVEFASEPDAHAFVPPAWFGREVTGDPRWGNGSLARHGRPD
ncbi:adenylate cyclase [Egicoccus sp. AB-alg2]|uniref:CYTH domain-containing protein n=1 Tax=Egicoccus sp. AB-alg2 TaxID=3242693 RepID=UPI00359E18CF